MKVVFSEAAIMANDIPHNAPQRIVYVQDQLSSF